MSLLVRGACGVFHISAAHTETSARRSWGESECFQSLKLVLCWPLDFGSTGKVSILKLRLIPRAGWAFPELLSLGIQQALFSAVEFSEKQAAMWPSHLHILPARCHNNGGSQKAGASWLKTNIYLYTWSLGSWTSSCLPCLLSPESQMFQKPLGPTRTCYAWIPTPSLCFSSFDAFCSNLALLHQLLPQPAPLFSEITLTSSGSLSWIIIAILVCISNFLHGLHKKKIHVQYLPPLHLIFSLL